MKLTNSPFANINDKEATLLNLIDIYDKAQDMFLINARGNSEFLDIVNYVEVNMSMRNVMLVRSKLVIIKVKALFLILNIEMYEDKNVWAKIYNNTNFINEMEVLHHIMHNLRYNDEGEHV